MKTLAAIDAAVEAAVTQRRAVWFDSVPREAAETLLAARDKFRSGGYGTIKPLTLAKILVEYSTSRGWKTASSKIMSEWLQKTN